MKTAKPVVVVASIVASMAVLFSATHVVGETQQVVITQFGEPVGQPVHTPGWHLKVPFIQDANYFDKRSLEWDGSPNQIPTRDKRFIWVDVYARWRISDPLLFFQRLRDERGAQSRLDDILDGETRTAIARNNLVELVRHTNRESADVPKDILQRMIAERKRVAERFRSEGAGEAARISGERERDLQRIQSEACRTAQETRGKADAMATRIYADAHSRDASSYGFMKSMETYEKTVDARTMLILTTQGELLRYFERAR